jgi:hypothetical protein
MLSEPLMLEVAAVAPLPLATSAPSRARRHVVVMGCSGEIATVEDRRLRQPLICIWLVESCAIRSVIPLQRVEVLATVVVVEEVVDVDELVELVELDDATVVVVEVVVVPSSFWYESRAKVQPFSHLFGVRP